MRDSGPVAGHAYHQIRSAAKRWHREMQGTPYNQGLADSAKAGAWAIDEELIYDELEELLSDLGIPLALPKREMNITLDRDMVN